MLSCKNPLLRALNDENRKTKRRKGKRGGVNREKEKEKMIISSIIKGNKQNDAMKAFVLPTIVVRGLYCPVQLCNATYYYYKRTVSKLFPSSHGLIGDRTSLIDLE